MFSGLVSHHTVEKCMILTEENEISIGANDIVILYRL